VRTHHIEMQGNVIESLWMKVEISEASMLHVVAMKITVSKPIALGRLWCTLSETHFAYRLLLVIYCLCLQRYLLFMLQ
jgi:hypothetical protein